MSRGRNRTKTETTEEIQTQIEEEVKKAESSSKVSVDSTEQVPSLPKEAFGVFGLDNLLNPNDDRNSEVTLGNDESESEENSESRRAPRKDEEEIDEDASGIWTEVTRFACTILGVEMSSREGNMLKKKEQRMREDGKTVVLDPTADFTLAAAGVLVSRAFNPKVYAKILGMIGFGTKIKRTVSEVQNPESSEIKTVKNFGLPDVNPEEIQKKMVGREYFLD